MLNRNKVKENKFKEKGQMWSNEIRLNKIQLTTDAIVTKRASESNNSNFYNAVSENSL